MSLPKTIKKFPKIPKEWEKTGTNLVYFGDFHYRKVAPSTRIDNFEETELQKARAIKNIAKRYHAKALLQPGDFLDKPKLDENFLNKIMYIWGFPQMIEARKEYDSGKIDESEFTKRTLDYIPLIGLIGNHELYGGSLKTYEKTSLSFLEQTNFMHIVSRNSPYFIKGNNNETIAISGESYDLNLLKKKGTDLSRFRLDEKKADVDVFMVHEALYDTALGEGMNWMPVNKIWHDTKADVTIAGHIHVGFGWINHEDKIFGNPGAPAQQSNSEQELSKVVTATIIHINDDKSVQVMDVPLDGLEPSNRIFDTTKKEREVEIQDQMKGIAEIIGSVDSENTSNVNDIIDKIAKDDHVEPEARELAIEKTSIAMEEMGANDPLDKNIDYSLKKIILKNFESHLHTEIDLTQDKTPTVLIGESSQGKSSLLRGIYWVLENQGDSKRFIRRHDGVTTTSVEIVRADGLSVKREVEVKLTKSNNIKIVRNGYTITQPDGTTSETNTEGLEQIQKLFGMNYLQLDAKDSIPINFMKQEDGWYFIGLKAPQRAKVIGALYGTQFILSAIKKLESERRSFESDRRLTLKDIDHINEELEPLKNIELAKTHADRLSTDFETLESNSNYLNISIDLLKTLKQHQLNFKKEQKKYTLLRHNITTLKEKHQLIQKNTDLIKQSLSFNKMYKEANDNVQKQTNILKQEKYLKEIAVKHEHFNENKKNLIESLKYNKLLINANQEQKKYTLLLNNKNKINQLKVNVHQLDENKNKINQLLTLIQTRKDLLNTYNLNKKSYLTYQKEVQELTLSLKKIQMLSSPVQVLGETNVSFYGIYEALKVVKKQLGGNMSSKTTDLINRIEALSDKMTDAKTAMEVSKVQGKQASDKLQELGIDPENADEAIEALQKETRQQYDEIEKELNDLESAVEI